MKTLERYERAYGPQYEQTKGMTTVEVAKLMRTAIKQYAKDGTLPSDWTYSVRSDYQAIWITVTMPAALSEMCQAFETQMAALCGMYCANVSNFRSRLVDEWAPLGVREDALDILRAIHSGPNWDGGDVQTDYFDVRYYGGVQIR